jgi:hypothetical protein
MLTILAVPKAFVGHVGTIQNNSLRSWLRLRPRCQVILFGDEKGTSQAAEKHGAHHVAEVARNSYGTPLISDLFEKAQRLAEHEIMCFVNSDIILMNDIMEATREVHRLQENYLIIGRCWNLEVKELIDFEDPDWESHLRALIGLKGRMREFWATDYFVFPKGFYTQLPPFAIGRAYFDNWLVWKALHREAPVIDATGSVSVVHQAHDYSHVPGGLGWAHGGEEALRNLELAGGHSHRFCVLDATHSLQSFMLKRNHFSKFRWESMKARKSRLWYSILDKTRPVRHFLGLRTSLVQRMSLLSPWRKKGSR